MLSYELRPRPQTTSGLFRSAKFCTIQYKYAFFVQFFVYVTISNSHTDQTLNATVKHLCGPLSLSFTHTYKRYWEYSKQQYIVYVSFQFGNLFSTASPLFYTALPIPTLTLNTTCTHFEQQFLSGRLQPKHFSVCPEAVDGEQDQEIGITGQQAVVTPWNDAGSPI